MNKFTFSYPAKVYFGEGSARQAFDAEIGRVGETVMLAFGGGSIKKNGIYDEMKALLEQAGKKVVDFSGIMSNPTYTKVQEGTDFQAHQMEHQLGAYTDCNHGQGLAVIHPAYYRHIVKDAPEKFARFAKVVFDVDTAEAGVDELENFIKECGLPTKMSQLKSTVEITPEVLRQVADTCNIIKCNPRELSRDEIYEILMECM